MPGTDSRIDLLVAEVQVLQLRVVELQERVSALELRGEGYEVVEEAPAESVLPVSVSPPSGFHRFSPAPRGSPARTPNTGVNFDTAAASSSTFTARSPSPAASNNRALTLQSIGKWIRLCLQGNRRGTSGRERLTESSTIYLIARAASGECFNPVKVCYSWAEARPLVKVGQGFGDSVFVGLPATADIEIVAIWAGLEPPAGHGSR